MRKFNNINISDIMNNNIFNLIMEIYEYRGKQDIYLKEDNSLIFTMSNLSEVQSITSSNRIEGIYTSNFRMNKIITNKDKPINRSEKEILGYRDVLKLIENNYQNININSNTILQLHRDLYKYTDVSFSGKYKDSQNYIINTDNIRFTPLSPVETPIAINELCNTFNNNFNNINPLISIPIFILDFLSIHPFNDGNGRISRLLTLLLLYKFGFMIGNYISIEKLIEDSKDEYYYSLEKSSIDWHINNNDYSYFIEYFLNIILKSYKEFSNKVDYMFNKKFKSIDRISYFIMNNDNVSKLYLINMCPDISETTIERSLFKLLSNNKIIKIGNGRYTKYRWNWDIK